MRVLFLLSFIALLATAVFAWEKEDHEIFDLVGAVEAAEGKGTSFYSWLDIASTASTAEISKAYRKKSMQLHPDKNPGVKGIHERFARLGVVATILRNAEGRKRYDFFYKNGVPKWRGTGYYYERFRPGVGTVFSFLVLLTSGMHYLVQRMTYKSDLARVERFQREARAAAWGPRMVPVEGRRKVRVALGGPARYDEDGNPVMGRAVEMVVEANGDVFLVDGGELEPLDASAATPPSISRTWFVALVTSLVRKATGKALTADAATDAAEAETESELDSGASTPASEASSATGALPRTGRAGPTSKAGGQRRKAVKRR